MGETIDNNGVRRQCLSNWTDKQHVLWILSILIACLLFAGACYQAPLFSSNQNMYFLYGMADAGFGYLSYDWLAQQTQHVPVFGEIVSLVHKLDSHWLFYAIFGALAAIYAVSLFVIIPRSSLNDVGILQLAAFFFLLTLIHSSWMLEPFKKLLPISSVVITQFQIIAHLLTNGLADQYILGSYLQPSAFGVLLIASVAFFISMKEYFSIFCAVFASIINPTYALHLGILTGAYMIVLISEGHLRKAINVGAASVLLSLPIFLYLVSILNLTDYPTLLAAQAILVEVRIPNHAKVSTWFSNISYIQLAIILVGVWLSRSQRRLYHVLLLCSMVSILISILQVLTSNRALALLFPWRLSAWLIPICTAIILARILKAAGYMVDAISSHRIRGIVRKCTVCFSVIFLAFACNLGLKNTVEDAVTDRHQGTVLSYAKTHSGPGQTYLIPLDLQDFRLATGLPIFVDRKAIPYRPDELMEWYNRFQLARAYYGAANTTDAIATLSAINKHTGITHVIVDVESDVLHTALDASHDFSDNTHVVYDLR